ncbi:MAG TPA: MXAN_5187 C-terminal domain-containing protein [Thermoanaerobaculia bacterium]|nr:MXAN_5187 C-terminal domain-containing protein [Thermoanaerobaculia bacterium]
MAVSIARDLDLLDKSIASLKLDYERFFSGDLKVPPLPARKSVEQVLRRVGNVSLDKAEERFRLQALQSRFTALSELWEKRLLAKEEGRGRGRPPIRVRSGERPAPTPSGDAGAAASVKGSGRGDLRSLFDRYCAARAALGEDASRLRYDRFEELVKKQVAEIRRATGATRLAFDVQTRDGKVRLVGRSLQTSMKGTT